MSESLPVEVIIDEVAEYLPPGACLVTEWEWEVSPGGRDRTVDQPARPGAMTVAPSCSGPGVAADA